MSATAYLLIFIGEMSYSKSFGLLSVFVLLANKLVIKQNVLLLYFLGAAGGPVRISCSGDNSKPPTIAEEAVDQLQENEKLVAGMNNNVWKSDNFSAIFVPISNSEIVSEALISTTFFLRAK